MKKLSFIFMSVVFLLLVASVTAENTVVKMNKGSTQVCSFRALSLTNVSIADLSTAAGISNLSPQNYSSNNVSFLMEAVVNNNSVNCLPVEKRKNREKNNNNSVTNTSMLISLPIREVQWRSSSFSFVNNIIPGLNSLVWASGSMEGLNVIKPTYGNNNMAKMENTSLYPVVWNSSISYANINMSVMMSCIQDRISS